MFFVDHEYLMRSEKSETKKERIIDSRMKGESEKSSILFSLFVHEKIIGSF